MASRGNCSAYLKSRLKRDHPAFYARLLKGEFPSPHAAAVAAGIIKRHTPLWRLQRAWERAPRSEKQAFLRWLRGRAGLHIDLDSGDPDRLEALKTKALGSLNPIEQARRIKENEARLRATMQAHKRRRAKP